MMFLKKYRLSLSVVLFLLVVTGLYVFMYNNSQPKADQNINQFSSVKPSSTARKPSLDTNRVIVSTSKKELKNSLESKYRLKKVRDLDHLNATVYEVSTDDTAQETQQKIFKDFSDAKLNNLDTFVEVDAGVYPSLIPNDPEYGKQWHLPKINMPVAWDSATNSANIIIADADTGADCTNEDLAPNCIAGWNTYANNSDTSDIYHHGTAVAGVLAAAGNNATKVSGVTWNSKIMPIRVDDGTGQTSYSALADAIVYAADHGAKVINVSYQVVESSTVQDAAQYMRSKGGLVISPAGNTGLDSGIFQNAPSIITVAATDQSDNRISWSTYGNEIDIAAPGISIFTTDRGNITNSWSGTCFSAPQVAGTAALIFALNPALTPSQVENLILSNTQDLGAAGWDKYYGFGRLDAGKAITQALSLKSTPDTNPPTAPSNLTATAVNATTVNLSWSPSMDNVGVAGYKVYRNDLEIATVTNTSYTNLGLSASTNYSYTVKAYDAAGNLSSSSNVASITTPAPILSFTTLPFVSQKTATSATITFTTSMPTKAVVYYGVKSRMTSSAPDANSSTEHSVNLTGLSAGVTYSYYVVVNNTAGQQVSSAASTVKTARR